MTQRDISSGEDCLVRVFTAAHEMEAALVQAMLEASGVWATVQGQNLRMIQGSVPATEATFPSVWVRSSDASAAAQLIEQYRQRPRRRRPRLWTCGGCGEVIEEQFTHCWKCGMERGELIEALPVMQAEVPVVEYRNPLRPPSEREDELEEETIAMARWQLKGVMPEMPVADVAAAVVFYCNTLDFQQKFMHGNPPAYAIVQRDEVQIALVGPWAGGAAGSGRCYVFVRNIEAYYRDVSAASVNIVDPLAARPYGMRDFAITDPDGNRLAFGEEVE